ncbi:MAG: hypothetical protein DRJ40_11400 [Thermoprotei archaeon]|nr:MAG: hypothetical protein DRJ40_11400 [Thermoprotei archaeon]
MLLGVVVLILTIGIFLIVHDILYHLGKAPSLGREVYVGRYHIHHGYIGLLLVIIGIATLLLIYA